MPRSQRPEGTRRPNGASSIYLGKDGKWHGRVTMGLKDDGSPDRRHVERKTEGEVIKAVQALERQRDDGTATKPGRDKLVEEWLLYWLEFIVKPSVKYKAYRAYRTAVVVHLVPGLGKHRMKRARPEHFEKLYARMIANGAKPATAHQVHRTARTAFGEAHKRGEIPRNPVELAKAPRVEDEEIEPYEIEEVKKLIAAALERRNGVRFVLGLAMGTRQGESIGFKWARLKKSTKTLRVASQLQRRTWEHGCGDPHACGERYHKVKPCKEECKRHQRKCPPPCPPDCTSHARWCPQKHGGGLVEAAVKSRAGVREFVLPDQLFDLLLAHEARQAQERELAGTEWQEGGWMFAQPNGRPIDPTMDRNEWYALQAEAGVRKARLHDARHTAATVMLILGVDPRVVMELMGWSNVAMLRRYQHVLNVLKQGVATQLGGLLWGTN
ncbi:tyrosine-type recombinase/integrase [Actinokineospora enzanensis]|uniref:tyrosine-type recombinase/integrase n=1 Tax=Actinokineospora enzanensis TaxID=155975 RepID=UPI0004774B8F|nr:tyrosine-type recombinase/integrase [Actinokineospora enzanensis]